MASDFVICTAVTGDYDHWGGMVTSAEVDYFFYTDNPHRQREGWVTMSLPNNGRDRRRQSKQPKLNPHMLPELCDYKYVIWIDGSMQVLKQNFHKEIISYLDRGMVISPHFDGRHCAYGEATIRPAKYANEPLDEQVEFYRSEGFPEEYGLYECGVIARDMTVPAVREVGEMWYEQNMTWSYQDQVSLPYVLWKTGFKPDVLPISFRDMNWVWINAHKSEA